MAFDYNALSQATNLFTNFGGLQKHEILTVSSLQQVKDFVMNKGDSYMFLDPNADLLYIRERDSIGKDSIRVFSIADVSDQYLEQVTPVTISKTEYNNLLRRLDFLEKKGAKKREVDESAQPELNLADQ